MSTSCVLVLDDDRGSCLLLRRIILSLGYTVDIVHNVADGLRAAASKQYCLVLIDCFMPDHTGWVASRAIKLLPRNGPPPAIIGILSYPDELMQRRCESSDMEGVLVKPFCKGALSDCLGRFHPAGQKLTFPMISSSIVTSQLETGIYLKSYFSHREDDIKSSLSPEREDSNMLLRVVDENSKLLHETGALILGELNSCR